MSYTPGPWENVIGGPLVYSRRIFTVNGARFVASVGNSDYSQEQTMADADLIASAPELLEALKAIVECTSGFGKDLEWHQVTLQVCREAIAKATGETM